MSLCLSRGVCNCATSTKRKLEACDADDKQTDTIIAWSLPHTADRLVGKMFFCFTIKIIITITTTTSPPSTAATTFMAWSLSHTGYRLVN